MKRKWKRLWYLIPFYLGFYLCVLPPVLPEPTSRVCGSAALFTVEEERVRKQLSHLVVHISVGTDEMHPRVLRKLADATANLLSIISEMSWQSVWFLVNGKDKYHVYHEEEQEEDLGNTGLVILNSILGKIVEQILLETISKTKDK